MSRSLLGGGKGAGRCCVPGPIPGAKGQTLSRGAEASQAPLGGSLAPGLLRTRGQVVRSEPLGPCPEMPGTSQLTGAWGWGPVSMPFWSLTPPGAEPGLPQPPSFREAASQAPLPLAMWGRGSYSEPSLLST